MGWVVRRRMSVSEKDFVWLEKPQKTLELHSSYARTA